MDYSYFIPYFFFAIAIIAGYFAIKAHLTILKEHKRNRGLK